MLNLEEWSAEAARLMAICGACHITLCGVAVHVHSGNLEAAAAVLEKTAERLAGVEDRAGELALSLDGGAWQLIQTAAQ